MKKIHLPDTVKIYNSEVDGYGDAVVLESAVLKGAFFQGTSTQIVGNTDMLEPYDAHCYVDETDPFVVENGFRLEGMYLVCDLYGYGYEQAWYKIKDVKLGIDKLLQNQVNNCHCFLQKCEPMKLTSKEGL